jgi:hypothetical protein
LRSLPSVRIRPASLLRDYGTGPRTFLAVGVLDPVSVEAVARSFAPTPEPDARNCRYRVSGILASMSKNQSSRHHYLPIAYQEQFCNHQGRLFRFDKLTGDTGEISPRWWYPKQLFFEWDRNNVRMGNIPKSLPETIYQQHDTLTSERLNALAIEPADERLLTQDRILGVLGFVSTLWVRSPQRDGLFAKRASDRLLFALSDNPSIAQDPERMVGIKDGVQVDRAFLAAGHFLKYIESGKAFEQPACSYVGQMDIPFIVLGDHPVLYRNTPTRNEDVFRNFVFPLSSRRLYWSTPDNIDWTGSTKTHAVAYNILAIEQATRYVSAWNLDMLKGFVDMWRKSRKPEVLDEYRTLLFSFPPGVILEDHLTTLRSTF